MGNLICSCLCSTNTLMLEQWVDALLQREDVCSIYKRNCILDLVRLITNNGFASLPHMEFAQ